MIERMGIWEMERMKMREAGSGTERENETEEGNHICKCLLAEELGGNSVFKIMTAPWYQLIFGSTIITTTLAPLTASKQQSGIPNTGTLNTYYCHYNSCESAYVCVCVCVHACVLACVRACVW